jgi:hypothetical protein
MHYLILLPGAYASRHMADRECRVRDEIFVSLDPDGFVGTYSIEFETNGDGEISKDLQNLDLDPHSMRCSAILGEGTAWRDSDGVSWLRYAIKGTGKSQTYEAAVGSAGEVRAEAWKLIFEHLEHRNRLHAQIPRSTVPSAVRVNFRSNFQELKASDAPWPEWLMSADTLASSK